MEKERRIVATFPDPRVANSKEGNFDAESVGGYVYSEASPIANLDPSGLRSGCYCYCKHLSVSEVGCSCALLYLGWLPPRTALRTTQTTFSDGRGRTVTARPRVPHARLTLSAQPATPRVPLPREVRCPPNATQPNRRCPRTHQYQRGAHCRHRVS
jgi:hypothetical protein